MAATTYSVKFSSLSNLSNRKLPIKPYRVLSIHFTRPLPRFSSKHNRISAVTHHSNIPGDSSEEGLNLHDIRQSLIRQEDAIIIALLERSKSHNSTYGKDFFKIDEFNGSLDEYVVQGTKAVRAKMGRYKSLDEYPEHPKVLQPVLDSININKKILDMYFDNLLPNLYNKEKADDGNYSSTIAVCDSNCLQSMSKRIKYGIFVAEAKYRASPEKYEPMIKAQDKKRLWNLLTNEYDEESVKERVRAEIFEQNLKNSESKLEIDHELIAELYGKCIIPLINDVEVKYLLKRLD